MKLNQLRALVTIAETGSIQEASRQLHLTQPALSKAIKELESNVGATLFVRSSKGIRLTPYGRRLVGHARLIGESVKRAREDLEDMKGTVTSELTVGVTPLTALIGSVANCLVTFRREFPQARLRVLEARPGQLLELLREGAIDFALTSQLQPGERGFKHTPACRMPTLIGVRKDHPLRGKQPLCALQEAEWLVPDPLTDEHSPLHRLFADAGLALPARVIECNSMTLLLELCWKSDALLLLSSESTRSAIIRQTIDFIEIDHLIPERVISLLTRDRHVLTALGTRLYDALAQALRDAYPQAAKGQRKPALC